MKTKKQRRARDRAVLIGAFTLVKKLDDPKATVEAVASTAVDALEDGDPDKVIRIGKIAELVGLSISEIKRRWRIEGDSFPKPIELGGKGQGRRRGCREAEIRRWLRERTRVR